MDFVAREDDALVFVNCRVHADSGVGMPDDKPDRAACERAAAAYLAASDDVEPSMIRFDIVSILVLGNDRAMLRHYRNAQYARVVPPRGDSESPGWSALLARAFF